MSTIHPKRIKTNRNLMRNPNQHLNQSGSSISPSHSPTSVRSPHGSGQFSDIKSTQIPWIMMKTKAKARTYQPFNPIHIPSLANPKALQRAATAQFQIYQTKKSTRVCGCAPYYQAEKPPLLKSLRVKPSHPPSRPDRVSYICISQWGYRSLQTPFW